MSNKYMTLVWEANLSRPEKLVCLAIADHVDDEGQGCFASYERLAFKTGYEPRQVMRIVDKLQQAQIIVWNGEHPEFGTNIWSIDQGKLPKLPTFSAWKKSRKSKGSARENGSNKSQPSHSADNVTPRPNVTLSEISSHDGQNVTPHDDISAEEEATFWGENPGEMSSNPSYQPPNNHPINPTGGSKLPPAMDARVNPAAKTKLARERANSGADSDEWDIQARNRPETALQTKIAHLTHSRYLSASQKSRLRSGVTAVWSDSKRPVTHPSPEDEWAAHPDLFAEYVEMCARRIREESGRPPSRDKLVQSVRRYERHNTGWLDFRKAAQEEKQQAQKRVSPSAKQNQYYYDPSKPDWMQ